MLTITCTIRFQNGAPIVARASAATPYDDVAIIYSGDVSRIPDRTNKCAVMVMRYLMQQSAAKLGGEFIEEMEGQFDAEQ